MNVNRFFGPPPFDLKNQEFKVLFARVLAFSVSRAEHVQKENEGLTMNDKLKKQLTMAVLILIGIFILFAIVGQLA